MKNKFKFKLDDKVLETPDNCEAATIRTGRDEEFVFVSSGIEKWAKENPQQAQQLYDALLPKKKRKKK